MLNGHFSEALANQIRDCRCVLNIHFYETGLLETARLLRPVMMGIPVLSEKSVLPRTVSWIRKGVRFVETIQSEIVRQFLDDTTGVEEILNSSMSYFSSSSKIEKTFLALEYHGVRLH
jgi:hypothetical protein